MQMYFKKNVKDFNIVRAFFVRDLFGQYHTGFEMQVRKWPVTPVQIIISELENHTKYHNKQLIDLGCGNADIQTHFIPKNTFKSIKSFDLLKQKPFVIETDIRKLPLGNKSVDIAIFCLSLMGKNYLEFI